MNGARAWTGRTRAGLRVPADLPSLDMDSSISRSCHIPPGGILLEQDQPAFLPTHSGWPMPNWAREIVYGWPWTEAPSLAHVLSTGFIR